MEEIEKIENLKKKPEIHTEVLEDWEAKTEEEKHKKNFWG